MQNFYNLSKDSKDVRRVPPSRTVPAWLIFSSPELEQPRFLQACSGLKKWLKSWRKKAGGLPGTRKCRVALSTGFTRCGQVFERQTVAGGGAAAPAGNRLATVGAAADRGASRLQGR